MSDQIRAFRHGDVVIIGLSDDEWDAVKGGSGAGSVRSLTLAEGEVTGHSHQLTSTDNSGFLHSTLSKMGWRERQTFNDELPLTEETRTDWQGRTTRAKASLPSDSRFFSLPEGGPLTHEEHATIHLPPGNYVSFQQREFWGEERRVYD